MNMAESCDKTIEEMFRRGKDIDAALAEAVRKALLTHKREGNSVPVFRDGRVVWLTPDEIHVDANNR